MLKRQLTLCSLFAALSLALSVPLSMPLLAAEPSAPAPEESEPPQQPDEEPELPPDQLVPPEEDPTFKPDPNAPLEEDFLRMRPLANPLYWRLELREQPGYTSNVDQNAAGQGSLSNRLTLTGLLRYTFPTNTQILLRSQGFLFNYFQQMDRSQAIMVPLSPTVSQWFWNQLNIYAGYVPILSTTVALNPAVQRFDHNAMLGAAWYQPFEGGHYLFGGYQADLMVADSSMQSPFSNLGNLVFAGYRHRLSDDLFAFADARIQPRGYFGTPEALDEIRGGLGLALQWQVFRAGIYPGLILEARGDYNRISNFVDATRNADIFSFGINVISAIQSES